MIKKILNTTLVCLVTVATAALLVLSIKGNEQNFANHQDIATTELGGPFENSGTNSRYALVQSIVEDKSFSFNETLARFASPDVVLYKDKYFTIFTPGVSFAAVPFYWLGKQYGVPQLMTFLFISFIAYLNLLLVYKLGVKLGASKAAAFIGGFVFLFGTNALAYSQTLTQHHLSTLFILLALLNASAVKRTFFNNMMFGAYVGLGFLMDFPNILMLFPIGVFVFFQHFKAESVGQKIKASVNPAFVALALGAIPFFVTYGLYNKNLTGSYTVIGQFIGRNAFGEAKYNTQPPSREDLLIKASSPINIKTPFSTRQQVQGAYILLFSDERSWIFYSPIVFLGIFGLFVALRHERTKMIAVLGIAIIAFDFLIYTMFGDPWGGWAFGPRYLIPAAAIASGGLALAIQKYNRNLIFGLVFVVLAVYSFYISMLGANTTQLVPPKVEAVALADPLPHTYLRNLELVDDGLINTLAYSFWLEKYFTPREFLIFVTTIAGVITGLLYLKIILTNKHES